MDQPQGHRKLIDYIGVPSQWVQACTVHTNPKLGDVHEDIDHQPILLQLSAKVQAAPIQHRNRLDARIWATPAGGHLADHVASCCLPVPWNVCTTTHVDRLQRHMYRGIQQCLPDLPPKPRNPALTNDTLALVRLHRHLRRCTKQARRNADRAYLLLCFQTWASRCDPEPRAVRAEKRYRIAAATRWAIQYRQGKAMRRPCGLIKPPSRGRWWSRRAAKATHSLPTGSGRYSEQAAVTVHPPSYLA